MTTVDLIVKAIEEHKSIDFSYHGYERIVSPYACGLNNNNEIKLLAMQTGGSSTSGVVHKLRFFTVPDMLAPAESAEPYEETTAEAIEPAFKEFMKFYAKC